MFYIVDAKIVQNVTPKYECASFYNRFTICQCNGRIHLWHSFNIRSTRHEKAQAIRKIITIINYTWNQFYKYSQVTLSDILLSI